MAQTTEAACLLESGSMFPRRLGLKSKSGVDLFAGVRPGGVSLYFGDSPIYHFDLDGRWQRAYVDATHYLKGLDGTVRSIDRERGSGGMILRRETLRYALASDLDASIRSVALDLIDDLESGRWEVLPTPAKARTFAPAELREFLERVTAWDPAAWFAQRELYLSTYGPPPFLPPDTPNALILQATLGDADGQAFGGAPPAEHYVRSPAEFVEHAHAVARLAGRRIAQHGGIFLGGADLLRRPLVDILAYLEAVAKAFPTRPMAGDRWDDFPVKPGPVHAFLDDFTPPLPDLDGWRTLQAADLGQVTLGVASGDPEIRSQFGKFWQDEDLRSTVAHLKAAGIGVGLVVLVGAGGRASADSHVEATDRLIGSLPLGRGDLVCLVDVRSLRGSDVGDDLSDEESTAQVKALRGRSAARSSGGPKLVPYNPLKRWA